MGYESAALLAALLGKAKTRDQVRDGLAIYERMRKERTGLMIRARCARADSRRWPTGRSKRPATASCASRRCLRRDVPT
jgi:hypothetical protein